MTTSANVELPSVPGASDDAAFQRPLPERPALVWAHAIQRVELSIDIEQRHDVIAGHGFQAGAGRTLFNSGDSMPRHKYQDVDYWN